MSEGPEQPGTYAVATPSQRNGVPGRAPGRATVTRPAGLGYHELGRDIIVISKLGTTYDGHHKQDHNEALRLILKTHGPEGPSSIAC